MSPKNTETLPSHYSTRYLGALHVATNSDQYLILKMILLWLWLLCRLDKVIHCESVQGKSESQLWLPFKWVLIWSALGWYVELWLGCGSYLGNSVDHSSVIPHCMLTQIRMYSHGPYLGNGLFGVFLVDIWHCDLANRSGRPRCHHFLLYVGFLFLPIIIWDVSVS